MSSHLLLSRDDAIAKGKLNAKIDLKNLSSLRVDEYHAVVSKGGQDDGLMTDDLEVIDISSGEEELDVSDLENETDDEAEIHPTRSKTNGAVNGSNGVMKRHTGSADDADERLESFERSQEQAEDVQGEEDHDHEENQDDVEEGDGEEPSFGDLIRANGTHDIDVIAIWKESQQLQGQPENPSYLERSVVPRQETNLQLPPGISLSAVLTQSLRSNDKTLLESCFHVHDLDIIRATIERLDSALAASLLGKLTDRLHHRPGRAGTLMVWIQWTLVAHGGYLAAQPSVTKRLAALHRVVQERASSLQPLLALKGKLDMLEAQMSLRRGRQARNALQDDEEAVIYVEGEESSDDEDASQSRTRRSAPDMEDTLRDEDEMDVDTDAALEDADESESDEESSDEASEMDDALELNGDIDHDDIDTNSDEASEVDEPPPKQLKLSNGISGRV